jgi:glycerate kinase
MRILIAPDKFRGSLEAAEVCRAIEEGVMLAFPRALTDSVPLADGGEGTARILTANTNGKFVSVDVHDPLGGIIQAQYGISGDGSTAFIEMSVASGLSLLSPDEYNPLLTSTFGTGELIRHALESGVKKIVLGIGGSATTDGGIGMAAALGYEFFDQNNIILDPVGGSLDKIARITIGKVDARLRSKVIVVACDVTNILYGKSGAAWVYGPQKGADDNMVESLDQGLKNLSRVASETFERDFSNYPGAGAAGGLGAGALWFLGAELHPGVNIVMQHTGVENLIQDADLVITGEGKVDDQTLQGKVIKGLAELCQKYHIPLAVVCGTLSISPEQAQQAGITYAVSVLNRPITLENAQKEAFGNIRDATFNLVRLFFSGRES